VYVQALPERAAHERTLRTLVSCNASRQLSDRHGPVMASALSASPLALTVGLNLPTVGICEDGAAAPLSDTISTQDDSKQ
jgi:hypothetical protein